MNLKSLSEQFIAYEKEFKPISQSIKNVYYWRLIRFTLYQQIAMERGLIQQAHPRLIKKQALFIRILDILSNIVSGNTLLLKRKRFVFFPHTRTIDGKDIYSDYLINKVNSNDTYIFYSNHIKGSYRPSKNTNLESLILYALLIIKKIISLFSSNKSNEIVAISNHIKTYFNTDIYVDRLIETHLFKFRFNLLNYSRILKAVRPEKIFLVTHYSHMSLIEAANNLGIPTYEIQHGTVSENHMGYYFPNDPAPPYFPSYFLCHGKYWERKPPLPKNLKTIVLGASHISSLKNGSDNKKNNLLFFSQGTVANDLFFFAIQTARLAQNLKIIYRLHPSEMIESYQDKIEKKDIFLPNNFEIKYESKDFFDDLKTSKFIATVYSTTIYEAMALGAKAIVIGLQGYNAVYDIIERGDGILVKTPEDCVSALKSASPCKNPNYYYTELDKELIQRVLLK